MLSWLASIVNLKVFAQIVNILVNNVEILHYLGWFQSVWAMRMQVKTYKKKNYISPWLNLDGILRWQRTKSKNGTKIILGISETQFSLSELRSSISAALKYRTIFLLWCTVFRVAQQTHQPVRFWNYTLLTNSGGEGKSAADAVGIYRLWSDADLTVLIARRRRLQNSLAQRRRAHIICACFF
jgi:hypothetical protein